MNQHRSSLVVLALLLLLLNPAFADQDADPAPPLTMGTVLEASQTSDWMPLDQANTLYMQIPAGRVVIRLAPEFAPRHVANIKSLVQEGYFDGLVIVRSQENYVVQWGDPAEEEADRRQMKTAKPALPPEFDRVVGDDIPLTRLPDGDVYAEIVGFVNGFPVAMDPDVGRIWWLTATACWEQAASKLQTAAAARSCTWLPDTPHAISTAT